MNRQITITDAIPSITESSPNPSSATDPAISAAVIPTVPSIVIQARLSHDNAFARAISRSRSGFGPTGADARADGARVMIGSSTGRLTALAPWL